MNSSNELRVVGESGVLAKKILTEKEFSFKGLNWHYENNFHLSLTSEEYSAKLKIKNHLCQMAGNTIKKITEIIHKNKKYCIQDNYSLHLPPGQPQLPGRETKDGTSTNDSDNKNQDKKIYIFKKQKKNKFLRDKKPEQLIRNTKNITKNFCKAFLAFLKSDKVTEREPHSIRQGIATYNRLLERNKYNNKLIKKIISSETLRDLFRMFLEKQAQNWISQSRVNDKSLHQEAISVYLNLFESMQPLEKGFSSESSPSEEEHESDKERE